MPQGADKSGLRCVKAGEFVNVDDLAAFARLLFQDRFQSVKGFKPCLGLAAGITGTDQGACKGVKLLFAGAFNNAGGGEGAEVVYPLRTNENLPRMILEEIGSEGQIMRKIYQRRLPENPSKDYYYIMRETTNTEAVLIEYGFIDNPKDLTKLQNMMANIILPIIVVQKEFAVVIFI